MEGKVFFLISLINSQTTRGVEMGAGGRTDKVSTKNG